MGEEERVETVPDLAGKSSEAPDNASTLTESSTASLMRSTESVLKSEKDTLHIFLHLLFNLMFLYLAYNLIFVWANSSWQNLVAIPLCTFVCYHNIKRLIRVIRGEFQPFDY